MTGVETARVFRMQPIGIDFDGPAVFLPRVTVGDPETGPAMGLGNSLLVTEGAPEIPSHFPLDIERA